MTIADGVTRLLFDTKQVVGGDLRGESLEDRLSGARDVIQTAARQSLDSDRPFQLARGAKRRPQYRSAAIEWHEMDANARGACEDVSR